MTSRQTGTPLLIFPFLLHQTLLLHTEINILCLLWHVGAIPSLTCFFCAQICLEKHECNCSLSNLQCDSHTGSLMQMAAVMCWTQTHDILCLPKGSGTENGTCVRTSQTSLVPNSCCRSDGIQTGLGYSRASGTPSTPSSDLAVT